MDLSKERIETDRLALFPISEKFREAIFAEFTEDITVFMYPRAAKDISETDKFIADSIEELLKGTTLQMVVVNKDGYEFVGCAGLYHIDRKNPEWESG